MSFFKNPLAPFDSPDPFITYDKETGYYYSLFTRHDRLELFRSKRLCDIVKGGDSKIIYTPTGELHGIYGEIWAPEMHRGTDGFWYIYTSGRITEAPGQKRLFIMKAKTADPFGDWEFVCKPDPEVFSIDPTVYTHTDGIQYMCCSRVRAGFGQVLDIIKMDSPSKLSDQRDEVAVAELDWELVPPYVGENTIVEGGFFVKNGERLFLIYSANGCWSDDYVLGVLEHLGGSLCDRNNWKKHDKPLLVKGNGLYGPGHASFFYSPDGTELWCAYHGMKEHNEKATPANRFMNVQRVLFDEEGYPIMGEAIGYDVEMASPSGEE